MPFQFTCPHCFYKTRVDESHAGQTGPCRNCGKEVTVPNMGNTRDDSPPELAPVGETAARDLLAENKRNRKIVLVTQAVVAVVGISLVAGVFVALTWPAVTKLTKRRDRIACGNNLARIAQALNQYAADHGTYPPPVVYDKTGKTAMHSWRVLILPQLGEMGLYAQYNMDEPWDSAANSRVLARGAPAVFRSPTTSMSATGNSETSYFLITGTGTLFPASGPLGPEDATDGSDKTLLVVESDSALIQWTDPQDIDILKLNRRIGASGPNTIGGSHEGGMTVGFVDGSSGWLPDDTPRGVIDGLISPDGNEPIDTSGFGIE